MLFGDLRLVPERVDLPGAKHTRHRGQDSVDNTLSMKIGLNFVHIWSKDFGLVQHCAAGRILFKSLCKKNVVFKWAIIRLGVQITQARSSSFYVELNPVGFRDLESEFCSVPAQWKLKRCQSLGP